VVLKSDGAISFIFWSGSLLAFHIFMFIFSWWLVGIEYILELRLASVSGRDISFVLLCDTYSLVFLSFVCLISLVVIFYSYFYIAGDMLADRFIYIVLLFVLSIGILIIRPTFIGLMLG